ncbi:UNKNOWN [Stylonychia lemnae]|uniref:Transmembrane protein n=1 Tax=Stylonychia lemnae TaxID=5949 RepID=A0A078AN82_STYLE|nr:UNKNOWN [Stylonychia lemnae]|eukprot:CDW83629.1 UNKNOWN [Stylonychia lemnae]
MSQQGKTSDQFELGDNSHLFRKQNKRTLHEVDTLFSRQESIRKQIGNDRADQIERNPDLFCNHERYRIYQHSAMFWTTVSSLVGLPAIFTALNGGRGGSEWARRNGRISLVVGLSYASINFLLLNRYKGFRNDDYLCHLYAKNHKMLRNILIKE